MHILGNPKDFIRELKDSNRIVKDFMDTKITNMQTGTLLWKWMDNKGKEYKFKIVNFYFVLNYNIRLLSP